jgi:hypothetical protein
MYMNPRQFWLARTQTRHGRLFELMRQENLCHRQLLKEQADDAAAIDAFRDMACASLRR